MRYLVWNFIKLPAEGGMWQSCSFVYITGDEPGFLKINNLSKKCYNKFVGSSELSYPRWNKNLNRFGNSRINSLIILIVLYEYSFISILWHGILRLL